MFNCLFLGYLLLLSFVLCVPSFIQQTDDTNLSGQVPRKIMAGLKSYRVHQKPSKKLRLPKKLREVSGLASTPIGRLFGHGDEKGVVYEIDADNGKILKEWFVGSGPLRGDFEGIAIAGEYFYLIASDGTLIRFPEGSADQQVPYLRIDTGLYSVCEVEGLEYDDDRESLLLACKTVFKEEWKKDLVVFEFSLSDMHLRKEPRYRVPKKAMKSMKIGKFHPSGIAIHPETRNLFIISGSDKKILELDNSGGIIFDRDLKPKHNRQAEGIAFLPGHILVLANEGNKGKAVLCFYTPEL